VIKTKHKHRVIRPFWHSISICRLFEYSQRPLWSNLLLGETSSVQSNIFNVGNQDGVCYLWNETDGKRGEDEIASCVYDYVMTQLNIKQVRMMSDGCGGQQKNMIFALMCMALCQDHPNFE
jgi:hypothetical protein